MLEVSTNVGYVTQIIGPVLDVEFPAGNLPKVYNAINIEREGKELLVCEVQQLLGGNKVRAVSMSATDGLKRGVEVSDTGRPISVPTGVETLGRIFNVIGAPVDELGDLGPNEAFPIHRSAPKFTELETKPLLANWLH